MNPIPPQPSFPGPESEFAESAEKEAARHPRKRGGFMRFMRKLFLLLLLAAAGVGAYAYYNPAAIAVVASFIQPAPAPPPPPAPPAPPTDAAPPDAPALDSPAPAVSDAPESEPAASPVKTAGDSKTQIALLSGELSAMRAQVALMESRLNQVDAAARTTRAADATNIRLLLAGLLLESNGDTQSASSALRRIADSASSNAEAISPDMAKLVRAEAVRLEQTPARARILNQIAELRRILEKPLKSAAPKSAESRPESFADDIGGFFRGAFNVSQRGEGESESAAGRTREQILNHLARMEFYLTANNRGQYRDSLDSAERLWTAEKSRMEGGAGGAEANIDLKFRILRGFGAPDYRLNLPLDKP